MVNTIAFDVPPPGAGLCTLTCAVPATEKSLTGIDASRIVVLISRVVRSAPFQRTIENALNPEPITRSASGPTLARPCVGSVALMVGAGLVMGTNVASARSSRIRGTIVPPRNRSSRISSPVVRRLSSMSETLAAVAASRSTAQAPATCGAAIDVPLSAAYAPPVTDEVMESPGANSERNGATFEKYDTVSFLFVEPTLTADEMQAGEEIANGTPLLPDATTVAMPIERRLSMSGL